MCQHGSVAVPAFLQEVEEDENEEEPEDDVAEDALAQVCSV